MELLKLRAEFEFNWIGNILETILGAEIRALSLDLLSGSAISKTQVFLNNLKARSDGAQKRKRQKWQSRLWLVIFLSDSDNKRVTVKYTSTKFYSKVALELLFHEI